MKNYENPELEAPHVEHKDALKPDAPDFVETPDVEPLSGEHEPLPIWIYLACGFALFLAGSSFTGFSIFGQGLYDQGPGGPSLASASNTETPVVTDPVALGKKVYNNNCASCHHADGNGQPGVYPPLGNSEWVIGSKERLAALLTHGVAGPLTVKGGSYGSAVMPAWSFPDDQMANLMTFLRQSWGNTSSAATAEEVSAARAKVASQPGAYSEADLLKIAPHGADPSDKKP